MAIAKRKKRFFNIEIPLINKQTQLQAYDLKELNGKLIQYDLTRTLRGKSIILQLKVKIEGEKAIANPRSIKLMPYFLRRAVRKGTNYIEDSFSTKCKNAQIRIKPFIVSRRKISRAVRKALREKAREELINYAKEKTAESLFEEILKNQIQKYLSLKLKKIYPLALCEIRVLKIEKDLEISEPKKTEIKEEKEEKQKN
jgi:ribosomal protein S3AE